VDSVDEVPIGILHVLEADIAQNAGIVDEDINATKSLDGGIDNLLAKLYTVVVGNGIAAGFFDFVYDNIGGLYGSESLAHWSRNDGAMVSCRGLTLVEAPSPLNEPPRSLTTTLAPRDPKNTA
jgi:hypothetical protein